MRVGWRGARRWVRGRIGDTGAGSVLVESKDEANGSSAAAVPPAERHERFAADPLAALSDALEQRHAAGPLPTLSQDREPAERRSGLAAPITNGSMAESVEPPAHHGADHRRRQMVLAAILALVCAAAAVVTVRAFVAASRDDFPGVIQPTQAIPLGFSEEGYLSSLRVQAGDHVRRGEILARMNPLGAHALKLAGQAADAAVAADQQQLTVAQQAAILLPAVRLAGVRRARAQLAADQARAAEVNSSAVAADQQQLTVAQQAAIRLPAVRLAGVRRARAQLAADQARAAEVKAMLDQATIRSPVDGQVTDVNGAVGELVGPTGVATAGTDQPSQLAQPPSVSLFSQAYRHAAAANRITATPLIQLAAGPTEMEAQVPESAVSGMHPGRQAKVTVPALGARFVGRLLRVVPEPVQTNGDVAYVVLFVVQRPSSQVLPGMSADVILDR